MRLYKAGRVQGAACLKHCSRADAGEGSTQPNIPATKALKLAMHRAWKVATTPSKCALAIWLAMWE